MMALLLRKAFLNPKSEQGCIISMDISVVKLTIFPTPADVEEEDGIDIFGSKDDFTCFCASEKRIG